jgi:hypothetical protein
VVSIDRSLLKEEAPRFSADFNNPLSYERPFKFLHHLVEPLGIDNIIAMSDLNINVDSDTDKNMDTDTDRDTDKDTEKYTDTDIDTDMDMDTDVDLKF